MGLRPYPLQLASHLLPFPSNAVPAHHPYPLDYTLLSMSQSDYIPGSLSKSLPESRVWTESERVKALAIYAETRSSTEVERITGIPKTTVQSWTQTEEGMRAVEQLRTALRERCAWGYVEQLVVSQDLMMKRLVQGDPVVLADGRIVYRGVSARDLMMIMAVSQDKHAALVGTMESGQQTDKALNNLANKLLDKLAERKASNEPKAKPLSDVDTDNSPYLG